jgi:cell division protein FtsW (lipid II flippase)
MAQRATVPMIIALLTVTIGFVSLIFAQKVTAPPMIYASSYVGMMVVLYLSVRLWLPHSDAVLIPIVALLTGIGFVMIYRLTYAMEGVKNLATTQVVWILVGSGALLLTILLFRDYQRLLNYKYLFAAVGIGLVGSTILFGYEINGAKLWLRIGSVSIEPSEFARMPLIIFFAGYLADKREVMAVTSRSFLGLKVPSLKYFGPVVLVWAASVGLLVFEKDVGISLLFIAVSLLMLYMATGRITYMILGGLLFLTGFPVLYQIFPHVRSRIEDWLNPWSDPTGQGYQITQSIFNIADGGLTGNGLGEGFAQTIPEVHTDFIFSAVAGELGLLGASALLLVFLVFVHRGMKIALLVEDTASKLLAAGLTSVLALQTIIIVGGVTKAIPLTGLGLPFVSYGGSSVVGNFILTGLLLVVSEQAGRQFAEERDNNRNMEQHTG